MAISVAAVAQLVGLTLEPFQTRILAAAHGRQREVLILLPRGNGKTTLMALDALHHFATTPGARVYVAAASEQQASLLFNTAVEFARVLGDPHIVPRYNHLRYCDDPANPKEWSRILEVRAADWRKLHGLAFTRAYLDEMQVVDERVYDAMASALHKRPEAKLIIISTAGQGADSPLGRLRARALGQPSVKVRGALTDAQGPGLRMLEWSLPEDANVDDPKVVKRVNPASWITPALLREQRERLPDLAYRRFIANQWTETRGHWLPSGAYQRCVGSPEVGDDIYIGVDVGGQGTSTAVVWIDDELHVGAWSRRGEDAVLDARDLILELASRHTVQEVVMDPWRAGQLAAELEREGLTCVAVPQTDSRMIPASVRLHRAILEQRIELPDDDELRAASARTVARTSRRGWRIDGDDIGPMIALAIALDAAEQVKPEPVQLIGWL